MARTGRSVDYERSENIVLVAVSKTELRSLVARGKRCGLVDVGTVSFTTVLATLGGIP
jgi:hypothetical protein